MVKRTMLGAVLLTACALAAAEEGNNLLVFGNADGLARTIDVNGRPDPDNAFFQDLGMMSM